MASAKVPEHSEELLAETRVPLFGYALPLLLMGVHEGAEEGLSLYRCGLDARKGPCLFDCHRSLGSYDGQELYVVGGELSLVLCIDKDEQTDALGLPQRNDQQIFLRHLWPQSRELPVHILGSIEQQWALLQSRGDGPGRGEGATESLYLCRRNLPCDHHTLDRPGLGGEQENTNSATGHGLEHGIGEVLQEVGEIEGEQCLLNCYSLRGCCSFCLCAAGAETLTAEQDPT